MSVCLAVTDKIHGVASMHFVFNSIDGAFAFVCFIVHSGAISTSETYLMSGSSCDIFLIFTRTLETIHMFFDIHKASSGIVHKYPGVQKYPGLWGSEMSRSWGVGPCCFHDGKTIHGPTRGIVGSGIS